MKYQYIYGSDTVAQGFSKVNENFNSVPDKESLVQEVKEEAVSEAKEWAKGTFSNPNLLINGGFDVWQRGETFDLALNNFHRKYTADRWILYRPDEGIQGTISKNENSGIKITNTKGKVLRLSQIMNIEKYKLVSKTVTMHMKISGLVGSLNMRIMRASNGGTLGPIANGEITISSDGEHHLTCVLPEIVNLYYGVGFDLTDTTSVTIELVKFELGEVATPYIPKCYADELLKCQSYTYVVPIDASFMASCSGNSTLAYGTIPTPVEMRTNPTVTANGINIRGNGVSNKSVTEISFYKKFTNALAVSLSLPTGFSANQVYWAYTTGQLIFDAEIY